MLKAEEMNKIMEMIDTRITVGLKAHTQTILKQSKLYTLAVMEERTREIKDDLKETAAEIFENMEFLAKFRKHIFTTIDMSITQKMNGEGMSQHITTIAKSVTKDIFKGVIQTVIQEVIGSMNKKLNYELEISKQLCYSIEADIKHVMQRNGTSVSIDEMIREKINETVNKLTEDLMIKQIEIKEIV